MILEVILLSFIVALIRKGKFKNILSYGIKFKIVFLLYILVQAGLVFFGDMLPYQIQEYSMLIYLMSYLLLMTFLARNIGKYEYIIILIGVFLNFAVTFVNGGKMPLSLDAAALTGLKDAGSAFLDKMALISSAMTADTKLSILGDIIPMPSFYPLSIVISPGDVVICIGAFIAVQRMFVRKSSDWVLGAKKEMEREESYFNTEVQLVNINEFFNKDPQELKTFSQAENNAIMGIAEDAGNQSASEHESQKVKQEHPAASGMDEISNDIIKPDIISGFYKPDMAANEPKSHTPQMHSPDNILNMKLGETSGVEKGQLTFLDPEMSKYVDVCDANKPEEKETSYKEDKFDGKYYPDIGEELRKQRERDKLARLAAQQQAQQDSEILTVSDDEISIDDLAKSGDEGIYNYQEETLQFDSGFDTDPKTMLKSLRDGEGFEYNKDKYTITVKDEDVPAGERKETFLKRLYEYDIDIRKTQAATTEEKEKLEIEIKRDKGINVDDMFIVQDGKFIENPNYKHRKKK